MEVRRANEHPAGGGWSGCIWESAERSSGGIDGREGAHDHRSNTVWRRYSMVFYTRGEMGRPLQHAGCTVSHAHEQPPVVEEDVNRGYVTADRSVRTMLLVRRSWGLRRTTPRSS
eukprot:3596818-Pyramimonas_sp.AAC.1